MSNEHEMDDTTFKLQVVGALSRIETNVAELLGAPGRKGRVVKIEEDVSALKKWRYTVYGGMLAIGAIAHFLIDMFLKGNKVH